MPPFGGLVARETTAAWGSLFYTRNAFSRLLRILLLFLLLLLFASFTPALVLAAAAALLIAAVPLFLFLLLFAAALLRRRVVAVPTGSARGSHRAGLGSHANHTEHLGHDAPGRSLSAQQSRPFLRSSVVSIRSLVRSFICDCLIIEYPVHIIGGERLETEELRGIFKVRWGDLGRVPAVESVHHHLLHLLPARNLRDQKFNLLLILLQLILVLLLEPVSLSHDLSLDAFALRFDAVRLLILPRRDLIGILRSRDCYVRSPAFNPDSVTPPPQLDAVSIEPLLVTAANV